MSERVGRLRVPRYHQIALRLGCGWMAYDGTVCLYCVLWSAYTTPDTTMTTVFVKSQDFIVCKSNDSNQCIRLFLY